MNLRSPEEFVRRLTLFSDDGILGEGFAEYFGGEGDHFGLALGVAQRGGGAHAAQEPLGDLQPLLQPPKEAGEVRALRAVEGVKFVDDDVFQRFRPVF